MIDGLLVRALAIDVAGLLIGCDRCEQRSGSGVRDQVVLLVVSGRWLLTSEHWSLIYDCFFLITHNNE